MNELIWNVKPYLTLLSMESPIPKSDAVVFKFPLLLPATASPEEIDDRWAFGRVCESFLWREFEAGAADAAVVE